MPTSNQAIPDYSAESWCGGEFAGTIGGLHWSFVLGSRSNGERGGGRWRALHVCVCVCVCVCGVCGVWSVMWSVWSMCEHICKYGV